ncbi:MipA/OmpV family protein [Marinomonas sp. CT5]|uniref:MipA/OmpV family protein n=1 Tax=Marinomonas sp. CT5 TaxID=2066133 RepID=UPI0017B487EE|nr:MipA/OmpV family protein [Marinomonas sp. CT5]NVK73107.1 MipA/OmpV family protein [Oceanospirillaceae bacterium]
MKKKIIGLLCLGLGSSVSYAGFQNVGEAIGWRVGVAIESEYAGYGKTDQPMWNVSPYISYDWENFHLGADGLSYQFFKQEGLSLAAEVSPRWPSIEESDSPLLTDIDRDTALEAGLSGNYAIGRFYVNGAIRADISDVHNGHEFTLKVGRSMEFRGINLDLAVGASYLDEKLNAHLYGVKNNEANVSRPAFYPKDSSVTFIEAKAFTLVGKNTQLLAIVGYKSYSSEIKKSPLIRHDGEGSVTLAIIQPF